MCPHTDQKHYAKNMCHNCYHRKGKSKMAWACGHTNKSHYSSGMCQNCYLAKYYQKRKSKMADKKAATETPSKEGTPASDSQPLTEEASTELEASAKRQKKE